ncbi:MAG TPA: VapE family protein [Bacteroidales bacterium]|nr:VapE family protein [Paludibacter sp.]HRS79606.1 VapE family protein [Spirochaetota bacterium]HRT81339.1 VapE family protein [Bacteroidales bacterium]
MVKEALKLKQQGFNPFPTYPNSKMPVNLLNGKPTHERKQNNPEIITWSHCQNHRLSDDGIKGLFNEETNISHIFTDDSEYNIVCIDIDVKMGDSPDEELRKALGDYKRKNLDKLVNYPVVDTPSGGLHIYCKLKKCTVGFKKFRIKETSLSGDFLSKGTFVILPPSVYKGGVYKLSNGSFDTIPAFDSLDDLMDNFDLEKMDNYNDEKGKIKPKKPNLRTQEDVDRFIQEQLDHIRNCALGERNSSIYAASVTMTRYLKSRFSQEELYDMIYPVAAQKVQDDKEYREYEETIKSGIKTGLKKRGSTAGNMGDVSIESIESSIREKYMFRFNEVIQQPEWKRMDDKGWMEFTDYDRERIAYQLFQEFGDFSERKFKSLIEGELLDKYHPFAEYFNSLPKWDGKADYIDQLAKTVTVEEGQEDIWRLYLRRWMIAAVACSTEAVTATGDRAVNHSALILAGDQGIGKTRWTHSLSIADDPKYRFLGHFDVHNKDYKILLSTKFLINLDEIEATTTKAEWGSLKSLLTAPEQTLRMPYKRYDKTFPRRASFIGSINHPEFLNDQTGSRRFLCVTAVKIQLPSRDLILHAWAQALALLRQGEKYWFDGAEIDLINEHNIDYSREVIEDELLDQYYTKPDTDDDPDGQWLAATIILDRLLAGSKLKVSPIKLSIALKNRGYKKEKKQVSGERRWRWFVKIKKDPNLDSQSSVEYAEYE